jgi:hypothetical protein
MLKDLDDQLKIKAYLKVVRNTKNNAYTMLPNGESVGSFANKHAVYAYSKKIESKRERARETRRKKRKQGILYIKKKKCTKKI